MIVILRNSATGEIVNVVVVSDLERYIPPDGLVVAEYSPEAAAEADEDAAGTPEGGTG